MTIRFELPQDIEQQIRTNGVDLDREARELYLVELYRQDRISHAQLRDALGVRLPNCVFDVLSHSPGFSRTSLASSSVDRRRSGGVCSSSSERRSSAIRTCCGSERMSSSSSDWSSVNLFGSFSLPPSASKDSTWVRSVEEALVRRGGLSLLDFRVVMIFPPRVRGSTPSNYHTSYPE